MIKVLFVCVHNAARSQMAEAFLNRLGEGKFIAESAGLEAGSLNPLVVEAMAEVGYDLSHNQTKSVFDFYRSGKIFHHVIKVCDEMNGQRCPIFPGTRSVIGWNFEDPAAFEGTREEKLAKVRDLRDRIKANVERLVDEQALMGLSANPSKDLGKVSTDSDEHTAQLTTLSGLRLASDAHATPTLGISLVTMPLSDSGVRVAAELLLMNLGQSWLDQLQQPHFYTHQIPAFIDEVENQMVPGSKGIRNIESFVEGFHRVAAIHRLNVRAQVRSVVGPLDVRPSVSPLIPYLEKSFLRNQPLAWLRSAQSNPWVLVVGARIHPYSESIQLEVVENGTTAWVDFTAWLKHDVSGGGLVSFVVE